MGSLWGFFLHSFNRLNGHMSPYWLFLLQPILALYHLQKLMFTKILTASTLSVALLTSGGVVLSQENPLCYMQKSDGSILDLSKLCKNKAPMSKPTSEQPLDPNQGSDGGQPSPPSRVLDPSVQIVPGQTQKPPINAYATPSELWQQVPGLQTPIQEGPVR